MVKQSENISITIIEVTVLMYDITTSPWSLVTGIVFQVSIEDCRPAPTATIIISILAVIIFILLALLSITAIILRRKKPFVFARADQIDPVGCYKLDGQLVNQNGNLLTATPGSRCNGTATFLAVDAHSTDYNSINGGGLGFTIASERLV